MKTAKAAVRQRGLKQRDALSADYRSRASEAICARVAHSLAGRRFAAAGGYLPIRSEVDPRSAMAELARGGARLAVPAILGNELSFRHLTGMDGLEPQGFGTVAPGQEAEELFPELLLVPLAAFDAQGGRCGYGRGFYDRAIARLAKRGALLTIGVAFEAQRVDSVPTEPHDRRLDMIVTESAIHRPSTEPGQ